MIYLQAARKDLMLKNCLEKVRAGTGEGIGRIRRNCGPKLLVGGNRGSVLRNETPKRTSVAKVV